MLTSKNIFKVVMLMKKLALVIVVILLILLGGNYYLWSNEVKSINQSLVKIESELAKEKVKFTYDTVDYGMMTSWDVNTVLTNVKFSGGEGAIKSEVSIPKVLIKKDNVNSILEMKLDGEMTNKIVTPMGEEGYKFIPHGNMPVLRLSFDKNTNEMFKVEYSDSGYKMMDIKTGVEVVSVDFSILSASKIASGDREKYEVIISTKNNVYKSLDHKYPELASIFKDVPDLGGSDFSINLMVDVPKSNGPANPMMIAMGSKVDLKELKYANKVFSIALDGRYDGTTTPMPSGNINFVFGNYEKFIDIMVGIARGAKDMPMDPHMKANVDVKDEQIAKFKDWLKQFKTNDSDIKLDFIFGSDGSSTLAGKPMDGYVKELDAIFMPPKQEVPAPQPIPAPMPEQMPAPQPLPAPEQPMPGKPMQPAPIPMPMEPQASSPVTK